MASSSGIALRLHRQGWSVPEIARELGIKEHSVRRSLGRSGVRLRKDKLPKDRALPRQGGPERSKQVVSVVAELAATAGALREFATELAYAFPEHLAAQEVLLAARRLKENAGDCLFHLKLVLDVSDDSDEAGTPHAERTAIILQATRDLKEAPAFAEASRPQASKGSGLARSR